MIQVTSSVLIASLWVSFSPRATSKQSKLMSNSHKGTTGELDPSKPLQSPHSLSLLEMTLVDPVVHNEFSESIPLETISDHDIIIALMGKTGVGKSSFINIATANSQAVIGHQLRSCTDKVQAMRCPHPDGGDRDVVFLDTPGFDDTRMTDTEILIAIADWLTTTYKHSIMLTGLLFLHRISDNRMGGTSWRNANVFESLCGTGGLQNAILVTTMWDSVDELTGSAREEELRDQYWGSMIAAGARMARFDYTFQGAWDIVRQFSGIRQPLQLQVEMVDEGKELAQTAAGSTLFGWLEKLIAQFKRMIAAFELLLQGFSSKGRDLAIAKGLERKKSEAKEKIQQTNEQKQLLTGGSVNRPHGPFLRAPRTSSSRATLRSERGHTPESSIMSPKPGSELAPSTIDGEYDGFEESRETMAATINMLRHARNAAEIAPVPFFKGTLCLISTIAESIESMKRTETSLSDLAKSAHLLIAAINAQMEIGEVSEEMKQAVDDLSQKVIKAHNVITKIQSRGRVNRYILQQADEGVLLACNQSIQEAFRLFQLRSALSIHRAIARIEHRIEGRLQGAWPPDRS